VMNTASASAMGTVRPRRSQPATNSAGLRESGERLDDHVLGLLMPLPPAPRRRSESTRDLLRYVLGRSLVPRPRWWPPRRRGIRWRRAERHARASPCVK
jgi:hypothetical protein